MKFTGFSIISLLYFLVAGCTITDGNVIVTGETRSAIPVEQVRLYRVAPEEYEELAIVSSSAGHDFKKSSSLMNTAIQRLKEEAAKIGANGVLLSEIDERDAPAVSTSQSVEMATVGSTSGSASATTTSVDRGDTYTRIRGLAIYVP